MPVDDVRVISNRSGGRLGHLITQEIKKAGGRATLIEGPVAQPLHLAGINKTPFKFFSELETAIRKEGKKPYAAVIHLAAVADYQLKKTIRGKIDSGKELTLKLVPTKKLIALFKKLNPRTFLVGFKLESRLAKTDLPSIAEGLYRAAGCDLIVANTATDKKYTGYLLLPDGRVVAQASSRETLARQLVSTLKELL